MSFFLSRPFWFFSLHFSGKSSPFIWGIIYFFTMDGFSRILEKKLSELLCTRLYLICTSVKSGSKVSKLLKKITFMLWQVCVQIVADVYDSIQYIFWIGFHFICVCYKSRLLTQEPIHKNFMKKCWELVSSKMRFFFWGGHFEFSKSAILNFFFFSFLCII